MANSNASSPDLSQSTARDAWFFENHPDRKYRLRSTVPGEFPDLGGDQIALEDCTIVVKASPAVRFRLPVYVPLIMQADNDLACERLIQSAGYDLSIFESARKHFGGQTQ